ncbi:MAG TPA: hypothetical protein VGN82_24140 [Bosea sp. (in: a-proteobacteria)]|jgi:hypothetical protein|uniref:hypothetical protein n=1 Tax=Bosea sp. (in: a-proteobacteria) TaxID=1871050 RepID=UPI002E1168E7|nr:hypothetical protein [Bosea sp. (in: a-proteobacteria)]
MTYVLNDASVLPAAEMTKTAKTADGKGFWQRLYAAMIESRRRSALRELRAYSYLINESEMVMGGLPGATVSADVALPFNR